MYPDSHTNADKLNRPRVFTRITCWGRTRQGVAPSLPSDRFGGQLPALCWRRPRATEVTSSCRLGSLLPSGNSASPWLQQHLRLLLPPVPPPPTQSEGDNINYCWYFTPWHHQILVSSMRKLKTKNLTWDKKSDMKSGDIITLDLSLFTFDLIWGDLIWFCVT